MITYNYYVEKKKTQKQNLKIEREYRNKYT